MKTKLALILGFIAVFAQTSFAQGNHTGGGDSTLTLPDGSVVIADPFIVQQSRIIRMNPVFENYLNWAKRILKTYSFCGFTDQVGTSVGKALDDLNAVHLVSVIPDDPVCQMEGAIPNNTLGAQQQLVGCTIKGETYIQKDLFGKLPLADQVSLLVHERLHAALALYNRKVSLDPSTTHLHIFAIAGGLKTALNRLYQQQHGDRTPLTSDAYSSIQGMIDGLQALGESCTSPNLGLDLQGGGLVNREAFSVTPQPNYSVDPTAFIGIGSTMNGHTSLSIAKNAVILNSVVDGREVMISEQTQISNSTLTAGAQLRLVGGSVSLETTILKAQRHLSVGAHTTIRNSSLQDYYSSSSASSLSVFYHGSKGDILVGKNSTVENTTFNMGMNANFRNRREKYVAFFTPDLRIGNQVTLKQVQLPGLLYGATAYLKLHITEGTYQHSPIQLEFADGLMLDRSPDPFRGCLNRDRDAVMTDDQVTIAKDSDLEAGLCTKH